MLCRRENVACFLRLLIVLKCTQDYFMMEVNILNTDQTATHAMYTIFCSG